MNKLRRAVTVLLTAALLCALLSFSAPVSAAGDYDFSGGLGPVIEEYMTHHNLKSDNFALGFYDTGTGTTYFYEGDAFHVAGSMYKLPLNMVFYDLIADGKRDPESWISRGYQIKGAMYNSIIYSDNEAAHALSDDLAKDYESWWDMWVSLTRYSDVTEDELPKRYAADNLMNARLMIGTLKYLYAHRGEYEELIGRMKQANPKNYLRYNDPGTYEIAHKYGSYDGNLNDCAIVFTPRPYLLVVFTKYALPSGERVMSDLRDITTAYALYLEANYPAVTLTERQQALLDLRQAMARVRSQADRKAEETP